MSNIEEGGLQDLKQLESNQVGFKKPLLGPDKYQAIKCSRIRYPKVEDDGTCYITISQIANGQHKAVQKKCTQEVFKRAYGNTMGSDPNLLPSGGYTRQAERLYWVYVDKDTDTIQSVTVVPSTYYRASKDSPVDIADRRTLEMVYYTDGGFEVVFDSNSGNGTILPRMPGDLKSFEMERVIANSAKTENIVPGLQLTPQFRVESVAGNRVTLTR